MGLLSAAFIAFQILYLFSNDKKKLDSLPIGIETILILIFIFYFFYEQLKLNTPMPLYKNYAFWIAIGILIYLSGTFFFYILVNHLPPQQIQPYWFVTYIFDIAKNIFLSIGILLFGNRLKDQLSKIKNVPYLDIN